jgi:hypothetical protein
MFLLHFFAEDTFLVESEKEDGSLEKKLYAIFTAPM